jgi:hypothetical protein
MCYIFTQLALQHLKYYLLSQTFYVQITFRKSGIFPSSGEEDTMIFRH